MAPEAMAFIRSGTRLVAGAIADLDEGSAIFVPRDPTTTPPSPATRVRCTIHGKRYALEAEAEVIFQRMVDDEVLWGLIFVKTRRRSPADRWEATTVLQPFSRYRRRLGRRILRQRFRDGSHEN